MNCAHSARVYTPLRVVANILIAEDALRPIKKGAVAPFDTFP